MLLQLLKKPIDWEIDKTLESVIFLVKSDKLSRVKNNHFDDSILFIYKTTLDFFYLHEKKKQLNFQKLPLRYSLICLFFKNKLEWNDYFSFLTR